MVKKSICLFCSMGCPIGFRIRDNTVSEIAYAGPLCARGHYNIELINHPQRLSVPAVNGERASWQEALKLTREKLKSTLVDEIAILVSCNVSNEEARSAAQIANAYRTKNLAAFGDSADLEAYAGKNWEVQNAVLQSIPAVESGAALLIVGDVLTRSPVMAKNLNRVKYGKRGNQIIVIDPNYTHTAWFATSHLAIKPGSEAALLAAMLDEKKLAQAEQTSGISKEKIAATSKAFDRAASGTVIFVPGQNKMRNDLINYFCRSLAGRSANKKYLTLYFFGNTLGVNSMLDREMKERANDVIQKIKDGKIRSLLLLGDDFSTSLPEIKKVAFTALSAFFAPDWNPAVTLPLASHFEAGGSYTLADGRIENLSAVVPKVGACSNLEILERVNHKNG